MSTRAYDTTKNLCRGIERIFDSAVCSGIVGDRRHRKRGNGTYHLSREDNPPRTYSVVRPDDRAGKGPDDAAAAFDISMNRHDMTVATRRLIAIWSNDKDPRRKYLNAFNGWLGSGDAQRYDVVTRRKSWATPDHTWHLHGELRRWYVRSGTGVKAILSALRGESVAQYLISVGVRPIAPAARLPVPAYPGRVLRRTTSDKPDAAVKQWQAQMIARGWKSIGKADGVFGARTESVVRRFQQSCKVTSDGVIGPRTWPLPWTCPLG
jgi:hypothetical protein